MKKQYENKITIISSFIFHLILFISYLSIQSIGNSLSGVAFGVSSMVSTLIIAIIFIFVGVFGALVAMIHLWQTYLKKGKNKIILTSAIINTMVVVIGILSFMKITANSSMWLLFYISIIGLVFHLIIILCLEGVLTIEALNPYLPITSIKEDNETEIEETTPFDTKKLSRFFKSKTGKLTIGILIATILVFSGYKVWDNFFNKTTIDVFENLTVTFSGKDGEGYAEIKSGDIGYNKTNEKLVEFIDDIYFDMDDNSKLSNGDTITVTVDYSKKMAKSLNVEIKNESMTFTVEGLTFKYKNVAELDKKLYEEAKATVVEKAEKKGNSFAKAYYATYEGESKSKNNYLVFVFKNEYKNSRDETKVKYVYYGVEFDSSYSSKSSYSSSYNLYKADSYDYVDNEADILKAIESKYSSKDNYKIEEIN